MRRYLIPLLLLLLLALPAAAQQPLDDSLTVYFEAAQPITPDSALELGEAARIGRGAIQAWAWSPESDVLYAGTSLGIWRHDVTDVDIPPALWELPVSVTALAVSPDGTRVAYGGENGVVTLLEAATGNTMWTQEQHIYRIDQLTFTPDGAQFASGDLSGIVRAWDAATSNELQLVQSSGSLSALQYSADGTRLMAAGHDALHVWDTTSWDVIAELPGAWWAEMSADGTRVAAHEATAAAVTVAIWDVDTGNVVSEWRYATRPISFDLSPDGEWLAAGNLYRVWLSSVESGSTEEISPYGGLVAFSTDGDMLLHGMYPLQYWSMSAQENVRREELYIGNDDVLLSPDGAWLAGLGMGRLRIIDVAAAEAIDTTTGYNAPIESIAMHENGDVLAGESGGLACLRDAADAYETGYCGGWGSLELDRSAILSVAFFPGYEARFAWGSERGFARGDWAGSESPDDWSIHNAPVTAVAFSPDGTRLYTASEDGTVHIHDTGIEEYIATFNSGIPIYSLAVRPGGTYVATGNSDGQILIWNIYNRTPFREIDAHDGRVTALAYSPDGELFASGGDDMSAMIWDATRAEPLHTLHEHGRGVTSVAFSADSSLLATGSLDGMVRVWDAATGNLLITLEGHRGGVTGVAFSTDGLMLASASYDGTIRLWGVE